MMQIEARKIGRQYPPYIIAELSANHNGSLQTAIETIVEAKAAGADAVKLQTYTPDTMTIDCDSQDFQIDGGLWDGYSLHQLYQEAHTPFEWHKDLFAKAREINITIFSSPFDESAVDLLEDLGAPAYKIASFEAVDLPLIRYVARTGKPMIISTGMALEAEINDAVVAAREAGCTQLALLHCVSSYPAPIDESNLRTIPELERRYGVVAGLSDHSLGSTVAIAATALGASVIEKHFTLSRAEPGPDSAFSMEPPEFRSLCDQARQAWAAIGQVAYGPTAAEESNKRFRRSLYVVQHVAAGERVTTQNVRRIRPGFGLAPRHYDEVLGMQFRQDVARGTALTWDLLKKGDA